MNCRDHHCRCAIAPPRVLKQQRNQARAGNLMAKTWNCIKLPQYAYIISRFLSYGNLRFKVLNSSLEIWLCVDTPPQAWGEPDPHKTKETKTTLLDASQATQTQPQNQTTQDTTKPHTNTQRHNKPTQSIARKADKHTTSSKNMDLQANYLDTKAS